MLKGVTGAKNGGSKLGKEVAGGTCWSGRLGRCYQVAEWLVNEEHKKLEQSRQLATCNLISIQKNASYAFSKLKLGLSLAGNQNVLTSDLRHVRHFISPPLLVCNRHQSKAADRSNRVSGKTIDESMRVWFWM